MGIQLGWGRGKARVRCGFKVGLGVRVGVGGGDRLRVGSRLVVGIELGLEGIRATEYHIKRWALHHRERWVEYRMERGWRTIARGGVP